MILERNNYTNSSAVWELWVSEVGLGLGHRVKDP